MFKYVFEKYPSLVDGQTLLQVIYGGLSLSRRPKDSVKMLLCVMDALKIDHGTNGRKYVPFLLAVDKLGVEHLGSSDELGNVIFTFRVVD